MTSKYETIERLSGARKVDFTTSVIETMKMIEQVKDRHNATKSKAAKAYLEELEQQFRHQISFLYKSVENAFPEDKVDSRIAWSSLGPESLLENYEFEVYVKRRKQS